MKTVAEKINQLRKLLKKEKLSAYIIPNNDEFQNEYLPASAKRLEYITGFTGSAGTAIISLNKAAFFTDGRYTLQAAKEVDKKIFEIYNISEKSPAEWLTENKLKAGVNSWNFTVSQIRRLPYDLRLITYDLVDKIWKSKPAIPATPIAIHPVKYSGESSSSKVNRIATKLNADIALITSPDSVNWLFNIRGNDITHTPFTLAYAAIRKSGKPILFIDSKKLSPAVKKHLSGVEIKKLELSEIQKICNGKKILLDPARTPFALFNALKKSEVVESQDPCLLPKAIKNKSEISGIKKAHAIDGAALTKFLSVLSSQFSDHNEMSAADLLESFRQKNPAYKGPSFDTICGFASNGAIVHYRASEKSAKTFSGGNLLLIDSGGQYEFGTTDVTRTIALGTPSAEMKHNYTLVLKGHIALATATFPRGTSGAQLDALARQFLWAESKDYDHGTGHGVGCYLSVHEGPQGISKRASDTPLQPGMILSNEPGYYKAGEYGIRIENLVLIIEKGKSLGFETLTKAPLDDKLIDWEILTPAEIVWVKDYQKQF